MGGMEANGMKGYYVAIRHPAREPEDAREWTWKDLHLFWNRGGRWLPFSLATIYRSREEADAAALMIAATEPDLIGQLIVTKARKKRRLGNKRVIRRAR